MAAKTPIKTTFSGADAVGLAEFQAADFIDVADGGTGVVTLTSGGVLVGAGTGAVTTDKAAPAGDFVGTSDSQTLTNKTLTSPTINAITKSGTTGVGNIGQSDNSFNTVFAKATSAEYADLAENYSADADYAPGTVLVLGGSAEVTECTSVADSKVAGVVSTDPAYLMNSNIQATYPVALALTGRVPCKVVGQVEKGDILVTSDTNGHAVSSTNATVGTVVGKAIESKSSDGTGIIEVLVGRF